MKGISYWFVIALQILSWVSATSRLFPPSTGLDVHEAGSGENLHQSSQVTMKQGLTSSTSGVARMNEIASFREGSKIGSSPPSCENKCYGCTPCEAIQVPLPKNKTLSGFSMHTMSQRVGNASVALLSTALKFDLSQFGSLIYVVKVIISLYKIRVPVDSILPK